MKCSRNKKVLVAMSGGVDSAVAAALLKDDGYDVVACFMRLGSDDPDETCDDSFDFHDSKGKFRHQGCCSLNDASDARQVAAILNVPFYVLNFRRDFDRVIEYFVQDILLAHHATPHVAHHFSSCPGSNVSRLRRRIWPSLLAAIVSVFGGTRKLG